MKTSKLIVCSPIVLLSVVSVHAQFQDLNFERADPVIDPTGPVYPYDVTAMSALPGWTVYLGNVQQADVLQNLSTLNQASVDIFGPSYPAAGPDGPGVIDGDYSVLLQAGNYPNSPQDVNASIVEGGLIPASAQSLQFEAYLGTPSTEFSVSINGNILTPVVIGTGANYTLYGADISSYAGTIAGLEFSALFTDGRTSEFGLDDISFSPNAVPEPGVVALTAFSGILLSAQKWFRRR